MASEGKARLNKPATVTFTLPISCQVCLGKVKQPVLCPNLHVFCKLCLDIWLQRNNQCPACRVVISQDNPVRHIIGGQVDDEYPPKKSTPDLRRARFDLLYQEYEEQFDSMRKEIIVLRTENNILSAQLKDAEEENKTNKKTNVNSLMGKISSTSTDKEAVSLLTLTKNLKEAQKLYNDIRSEMAKLRQENTKLKEESISLTRENETIRLELAQRSPKKFGRYTVATLETKVSEQENEIRRLTKALERSDAYVEELQQELKRLKGKVPADNLMGKTRNPSVVEAGVSRFQIDLEPKPHKQTFSFPSDASADNTRRVLFGKLIGAPDPTQSTAGSSASQSTAGSSASQSTAGSSASQSTTGSSASQSTTGSSASRSHFSSANWSTSSSAGSSLQAAPSTYRNHDDFYTLETSPKEKTSLSHSDTTTELYSNPSKGTTTVLKPSLHYNSCDKKNVHRTDSDGGDAGFSRGFSEAAGHPLSTINIKTEPVDEEYSSEVTSSNTGQPFDHVTVKSEVIDEEYHRAERTPTKKVHFNIPEKSGDASSFDLEQPSPLDQFATHAQKPKIKLEPSTDGYRGMSDSEFDKRIMNLLKETHSLNKTAPRPAGGKSASSDKKSSKPRKKGAKKSNANVSNDSSHLSIPDLISPDGRAYDNDHLDLKEEVDDLDYSITPEMTDCLNLMNRAEQNLGVISTGQLATPASSGLVDTTNSAQTVGSLLSSRMTSSSAYGAGSISVPSHTTAAVPPSVSVGSMQRTSLTTNPTSGWEQQFYSSLRANPYKSTTPGLKQDELLAKSKQDTVHEPSGTKIYSILDLKPSKGTVGDFHFSDPIKIGGHLTGTSVPPYGASVQRQTFQFSEPTQQVSRGLPSPFTLSFPNQAGSWLATSTVAPSKLLTTVPSQPQTTGAGFPTYSQLSYPSSTLRSSAALSSSTPNLSMTGLTSGLSLPTRPSQSHTLLVQPHRSGESHTSHMYIDILPPSLNGSQLEWPDDSPVRHAKANYDDLPMPPVHSVMKDSQNDSFLTSGSGTNNYSDISNISVSSGSGSLFLPEPKKRLFNTVDEMDFTISPKTTKR